MENYRANVQQLLPPFNSNPELVTYPTDGVGSVPHLSKADLSSSAN